MEGVKEKRENKLKLLERKNTLENLLRQLVKENLEKIKNTIYFYKEINIDIEENCIEKIVINKIENWIYKLEIIILEKMINLFFKNIFVNIEDDFFTALIFYKLCFDRILSGKKSNFKEHKIECCINLINGNLNVKNSLDFKFPYILETYKHIDKLFSRCFILKIEEEEFKDKFFISKVELILRFFYKLEEIKETDLNFILLERYKKNIFIPPLINLEELKESYKFILEDKFLKYVDDLILQNSSIKKKSVLINFLVLCIPYLTGKLDISFFERTEEYYNVFCITKTS